MGHFRRTQNPLTLLSRPVGVVELSVNSQALQFAVNSFTAAISLPQLCSSTSCALQMAALFTLSRCRDF
jgi:hypothetical protein